MTHYLWQNSGKLLVFLIGCNAIITGFVNSASAQIVPDNTLGNEASQVFNVPGFAIPIQVIEGGAVRGGNLFHSFSQFNVSDGQGVYFANPTGIQNILSRVTGTEASRIFGLLGVDGNANLFLINPNGIVFGPNALLDVRGAFVGTTANSLLFPNSLQFSATNPQDSSLLSINIPIGLQFGSQPGSITNQAVNFLGVGSGSTLALVGGEIDLNGGTLFAQDGQVKLAAIGGDTTIGLDVDGSSLGFDLSDNTRRAAINFRNGSFIVINGNSVFDLFGGQIRLDGSDIFLREGGSISVDATQFNFNNGSNILSATFSAAKGGDIQIQASEEVILTNSSTIRSETFSTAKGGDIQIQASDAVTFINGSRIFSSNSGSATGKSGDVTINSGRITVIGNGVPGQTSDISVATDGEGDGGNLTLNARDSVNIDGSFVSVTTSGAGKAGNLTVRSADALSITNQSILGLFTSGSGSTGNLRIETGTLRVQNTLPQGGVSALTSGSGSVGSISIQARNAVEVTNGRISTFIRPGSTTQVTAGDITIETQRVNIKDGGSIRTDTYSSTNAGNIFIKASEYVEISGVSSLFPIPTNISSGTGLGATGKGGNITIEAPRLALTQGGQISATSALSNGNAGNINIRATDVELDGFAFIPQENFTGVDLADIDNPEVQEFLSNPLFRETLSRFGGFYDISSFVSDVSSSNADVRGGTITIDTERLRLSNGANISSSVFLGRGQGGNVVIRATDFIDINGVGPIRVDGSPAPSGLLAELQTGAIGSGGSIDVTTGSLKLSNGGLISAATFNQGNAGNININANQIDLRGSSIISTGVDDGANGNAGNINITTQLLNIKEESQISSGTQGIGNAGNLKIQADNIILTGSDSEFLTGIGSSVDRGANGKGGDINVTTNRLIIRNSADVISGSLGTGEAGDIEINANFVEISGEISSIGSNTLAGNGGDITLNIGDFLLLRRGGLITTTAGTAQAGGNGGNININAGFIIAVPEEDSNITANAFSGTGGRVQINTQGIFGIEPRPGETNFSDITASSATGINGEIIINTPNADPSRGLVELPANTVNTASLVDSSCSAFDNQTGSQFTVAGRGGLPPSPSENLASDYLWTDTRITTAAKPQNGSVNRANKAIDTTDTVSIIPATNWVFNKQGEVTLVSQVAQRDAYSASSHQVACRTP